MPRNAPIWNQSRPLPRARILVLLFLAYAVSSSVGNAQRPRDDNGVRTVRYAADAKRPRWHIDETPILEISESTGDPNAEFAGVVGVAVLSSGIVAVANRGTSEIRYFDPKGRFVRSAGRSGQGPGEFALKLAGLRRVGDTLIATDAAQRAQYFSADGKYLRSLPRPTPRAFAFYGDRLGFMPDGRSVMLAMVPLGDAASGRAQQMFKLLYVGPASDSAFQEVGTFPGYELQLTSDQGPRPVWFGPQLRGTVTLQHVCVGYPQEYKITCFDFGGRQALQIERAWSPRKVAAADRELIVARGHAAARTAPPEVRERLENQMKTYAYAEHFPAFGTMITSATGELWVKDYDISDALGAQAQGSSTPVTWSVFGPLGEWVADVVLPPRFTPFDFGTDYVAGVSFNEDDVESASIFRLRR